MRKKTSCDNCGTGCKARHMLIEEARGIQTDEGKTRQIGLCWPCMRAYQIAKNNGKTNFETLWDSIQRAKEELPE